MKEYNKEKLHEYAKELFALCLEKGLHITKNPQAENINVYNISRKGLTEIGTCYISNDLFDLKDNYISTIWELIEKVKQL